MVALSEQSYKVLSFFLFHFELFYGLVEILKQIAT